MAVQATIEMPRGVTLPGLRAARMQAFLTQEELARRAGVAAATIVRLEKGTSPAELPTVRKLAEALGVEPVDLTRPVD